MASPFEVVLNPEQVSGEVQFESRSLEVPGTSRIIETSCGYRRSTDFDASNQPGQDFAHVQARDGWVVGVVADGVSQSFFGELAARYLSNETARYLWERRQRLPAKEEFEAFLLRIAELFRPIIDEQPIPNDLPAILKFALERTRSQGSQAVFAAFVFNGVSRTLTLFQVGDADAVVHRRNGAGPAESQLVRADPCGRWSSHGEPRLSLSVNDFTDVAAVVIRSDGARDWGNRLDPEHFNAAAFRKSAEDLAGYDDVSFVSAVIVDRANPYQAVPPDLIVNPETEHEAAPRDESVSELDAVVGAERTDGAPRKPERVIFVAPGRKERRRISRTASHLLVLVIGIGIGIGIGWGSAVELGRGAKVPAVAAGRTSTPPNADNHLAPETQPPTVSPAALPSGPGTAIGAVAGVAPESIGSTSRVPSRQATTAGNRPVSDVAARGSQGRTEPTRTRTQRGADTGAGQPQRQPVRPLPQGQQQAPAASSQNAAVQEANAGSVQQTTTKDSSVTATGTATQPQPTPTPPSAAPPDSAPVPPPPAAVRSAPGRAGR